MRATEQTTPQSTAPVTRLIDTKSLLQVTTYYGDKASFLGWKWSFLIAMRAISKPLYGGLKKIEDNMNLDFQTSRLSNEDLELSDQAYTLFSVALQRCCEIRGRRKRLSSMASPLESTNSSECDKPFESVTGTNIYVTRPTRQSSIMAQTCHVLVNAEVMGSEGQFT